MIFYIPSFYGDIQLERLDDGKTRVVWFKLTPREKGALEVIRRRAIEKSWVPSAKELLMSPLVLDAKLSAVQKLVAKTLKPDRKLLSAVKFADGRMQEITEANFVDVVDGGAPAAGSAAKPESKPVAAVAVAEPRRGCPVPDFVQAEIKARAVLDVFLDEQQRADFRTRQQFLSRGADTGHVYVITSRHALDSRFQRSLYDLTDAHVVCTHDYTVPAAEEVLALHLMVSLPGWETVARGMPEAE